MGKRVLCGADSGLMRRKTPSEARNCGKRGYNDYNADWRQFGVASETYDHAFARVDNFRINHRSTCHHLLLHRPGKY